MENTAAAMNVTLAHGTEEIEKKKKTFLEILKELFEIFRKPGYYGAMKEIENNLNELTYTNALTSEVLDNLISTVGEVKGNLNDMSSEKAESIIEDIQTKVDGLKNRVADFDDIRTFEGADKCELYKRNNTLYMSEPSTDGTIGNIAYPVQLVRQGEAITVSVDKEKAVNIDALESDEYIPVPLSENGDSRMDRIIHTVVANTLTNDERQRYFANEKVIENLNNKAQELHEAVTNQETFQKSLSVDNGKYKTYINENKQFCVADTEQSILMVFNVKENKLLAECYEIGEDQKPTSNHALIAASWSNNGEKIKYSRTLNNNYDTAGIFQLDAVQQYLTTVIKLPEDHVRSLAQNNISTPNMNYEKLTKSGERRINKLFRMLSKELEKSNIALDKQISNEGSYIRFKSSRGDVTQLNFNAKGEATNIEYDEVGDGKNFVRTHRIIGDMITPEMQTSPFCQYCVGAYSAAVHELAKNKEQKHITKTENPNPKVVEQTQLEPAPITPIELAEPSPPKIMQLANSIDMKDQILAALSPEAKSDVHEKLAVSDKWQVRAAVAQSVRDKAIVAELASDENANVRRAIAARGLELDKLVSDTDIFVLSEVAKHGNKKHLDTLIAAMTDESTKYSNIMRESVLIEVAGRDYGTDKLVNSPLPKVRASVAAHGHSLDILANDKDENVRAEVAKRGAYLKLLIDDESEVVQEAVKQYFATLPNDLVDKALSAYPANRVEAVKDSRINDNLLDMLSKDAAARVRTSVAEKGYSLDTLINDRDMNVRIAVAKQHFGLDTLISDKYREVRIAVAQQGYGLNLLAHDNDEAVRAAVALQADRKDDRKLLEELVQDKSQYVRKAVASRGYGLDTLISDNDELVRAEVAKHGEYYADLLRDDKSDIVRAAVMETLHIERPVPEQNTPAFTPPTPILPFEASKFQDILKSLSAYSYQYQWDNNPFTKIAAAYLKKDELTLADSTQKVPVFLKVKAENDGFSIIADNNEPIRSMEELKNKSEYLAAMIGNFVESEKKQVAENQKETLSTKPVERD